MTLAQCQASHPVAQSALAEATVRAGGSQAIASRLRVPPLLAAQWMQGAAVLPAGHCAGIEELTGVKCEALRPDLMWIRVAGEVLGFVTPIDGADRAYIQQALRNEAVSPLAEELIDGKWQAPAYVAGITHGMKPEAAKRLLNSPDYAGKAWTRELLDSLAEDVADETDRWSASTYCMGMLRGLDDAASDALMKKYSPSGWDSWSEAKSEALWAEAEAIRRRDQMPASRGITTSDIDRLTSAARDVLRDIATLKDRFARGDLIRKHDEEGAPWPAAAISESGVALDEACGDVLVKLAGPAQDVTAPSVLKATEGGDRQFTVEGATLTLAIAPHAALDDCLADGLGYLDAAIAVGMERVDSFDQSTWAVFHLLSLARGVLYAASDKIYKFSRQ